VDGQSFDFDHGAQYLTAQGSLFRATLEATHAKPWPDEARRVGVPRMSSIPRALAQGLDVGVSREVVGIVGEPGAWRVRHAAAAAVQRGQRTGDVVTEEGPFEAVVIAVPAPQAARLLAAPAPHLGALLEQVRMAPCWTLMAAFAERLPLPDTLRIAEGPITWAARDSSKPGRNPDQECWVVQAGPAWSREHLELPGPDAVEALLAEFATLAGGSLPQPIHAGAHRWRFALVETPLGAPCLWDPVLQLGAAGDWCIGARAEAAVDSGAAMAALLAGTAGQPGG
jgi:predicted NAD/FAD-dependent oxidoreductase